MGRIVARPLATLLLALVALAAACSGPSEGAPATPSVSTVTPAVPAEATAGTATEPPTPMPASAGPGGTAAIDTCGDVAAAALTHIDALIVSLEAVVDDDETLDGLLLRLVSEQPLTPGLEPLLELGPGRPFAGLGGTDVARRYGELECEPDGEYAAIDAWLVARYGAAFPALAAGGRDVLVNGVLPSIEAAGEMLVVATMANRRYHAGPPDGGSAAGLVAVLLDAVEAQEAHRAATGRYASVEADLVPYGFDSGRLLAEEDYFFLIWDAGDDAYCMGVSKQGSAYVESHDATPVVEDRREPCPNTFSG